MNPVRSSVLAVAAALALGATASPASANGGCSGPFCNQPKYPTLFGAFAGLSHKQPVFQAAPWYLYWPYDAHFLTPAPVGGAFYGPPGPGNFPVNPYFPQPNAPHAPVPGGAAPYAPGYAP